jgi:DNA-binding HxlR family transcriptional regulator
VAGQVEGRGWTFLTNHARVLIAVARDPHARLRDLSARIGITERAAQGILSDLEAAGFVDRTRVGRRNEYTVHPDLAFRHPLEAGHDVGELLALFVRD